MDTREITLINPDSPFLADPKTMPPLGLLYIASSLKSVGVKVNFIDLSGTGTTVFGVNRESRYYGISATTPQFKEAVAILKRIKFDSPDSKVCIGGPHATLRPSECLEAGFDCVIAGEGEKAMLLFLRGDMGMLAGYLTQKEVDLLPFPDRTLISDYNYTIDGVRVTTMVTSRGNCPYHCAFCSKSWIHSIRFRTERNVREELEEIVKKGYGGVLFYDDEFFINRERDFKICSHLADLNLVWRCFTRANLVNEEVARVASSSGCREILIGIESGNNTILQNINKGTTVEKNIEAIKVLNKFGIRVKATMIIGLPGENEETLKETWNFCETMEYLISDFDFSILVPYPGSPIYEHPEKYDIRFSKDDIYTPFKGGSWRSIVSTTKLSKEEITAWRKKFHIRFKPDGVKYL